MATPSLPPASPDFLAVFEAVPTPYLVLNPDLIIVAANSAYLDATQRTRQEIMGHYVFDAFPDNPNSRAVTDAMLALAQTLGLEVVAEGLETSAVLDYLRLHGCHQAQGYLFSKPMPGEVFQAWYRKNREGLPTAGADQVRLLKQRPNQGQ